MWMLWNSWDDMAFGLDIRSSLNSSINNLRNAGYSSDLCAVYTNQIWRCYYFKINGWWYYACIQKKPAPFGSDLVYTVSLKYSGGIPKTSVLYNIARYKDPF